MTNEFSDYNLMIVALSYVVSVLGAFVSLNMADYIRREDDKLSIGWTAMVAVVFGGCAIWTMHFIGMLAYQPGVPVTYGINLTLASMVLPMLFCTIGFYVVFRWSSSLIAWLASGVVLGLGVSAMHYVGMDAMRTGYVMTYDQSLVLASIAIGIVAATAALRIFVHLKGGLRQFSPFIMGIAVCGMHYTGMAAMQIGGEASGPVDYFTGAWSSTTMAFATGTAMMTTLVVGAALVVIRRLSDTDAAVQADARAVAAD